MTPSERKKKRKRERELLRNHPIRLIPKKDSLVLSVFTKRWRNDKKIANQWTITDQT